jgi:hypothetical protein
MRSRLVRVALSLVAVLVFASGIACKKSGAPAAGASTTPAVTPNAASAAASSAAALELFKAMKLQDSLQDTTAAMIDSEVSRNPGLTPYREVMLQWLRKYMTWDAMLPELTKMYTETFTDAELKEMTAFYGSPAGQKSLTKIPELMQRTAMIGARLGQAHSDELKASMTAHSEELKKQAETAAAVPGQGQPGMGQAPAPKPAAPKKQPQPKPQPQP